MANSSFPPLSSRTRTPLSSTSKGTSAAWSVCPHCGERKKIGRLQGKTTRPGCASATRCRKPFTVRIGSIFEDSHCRCICGLQSFTHVLVEEGHQHPSGAAHAPVQLKTAWHLTHRIRLAMVDGARVARWAALARSWKRMRLLRQPAGRQAQQFQLQGQAARSRPKFGRTTSAPFSRWWSVAARCVPSTSRKPTSYDVARIVKDNAAKESRLHTDEKPPVLAGWRGFAAHEALNHGQKEYARGD